jgi:hypothetical protein
MSHKIWLIVAVLVAIGLALAVWFRSRGRISESAEGAENSHRELNEAEIRELLRTIPAEGWGRAQEIQSQLCKQDTTTCRKTALEVLAAISSPPPEDYWTMCSLSEIAGHPIPGERAQSIIRSSLSWIFHFWGLCSLQS